MSGYVDKPGEFFGYRVEKISDERGKVNYYLHGPRAIYRLIRHSNGSADTLYAINTHGNICGIKGNYNFSDESGELHCIY